MFKHYVLKGLLLMMLLSVLSACATVSSFSPHAPLGVPAVTLPMVELVQVELPTPIVEVQERQIPLPLPLRELHQRAEVRLTEAEIQCMAHVMYFEARGEGAVGMAAVGYVVLNRMAHPKFPNSVCGVVYDRNRRGCQFSWTCDGKPDHVRNGAAYAQAREIALDVMSTRLIENPIDDSIFFRHHRTHSRYAHSQRLVAHIGQHKFFAARM